jgi:uncharacterized protein
MTTATPIERKSSDEAERRQIRFARFARRRPITAFLLGPFGISQALLAVPLITGLLGAPFFLVANFVGLLGWALVVSRVTGGPGAARQLRSRVLMWRFGAGRWAVIVFGVPVLTIVLSAASGTLQSPAEGWARVVGVYLLGTFVQGALLVNVWEETAWSGFVQSRLMERHGLLVGSLLTAPLFAGAHLLPLFAGDWTWSDLALLLPLAIVYRYQLGMHLLDTGGSVLAAGVQHASWNASLSLGVMSGHWQANAAVVLLTVLMAVDRRVRHRERRPMGRDAERAAAAQWTAPRAVAPHLGVRA